MILGPNPRAALRATTTVVAVVACMWVIGLAVLLVAEVLKDVVTGLLALFLLAGAPA